MHCIRAESQGKHDGRVRGMQGHAFFTVQSHCKASGKCPTLGAGYGMDAGGGLAVSQGGGDEPAGSLFPRNHLILSVLQKKLRLSKLM